MLCIYMLTNSLQNVLVSHQSWWISRSDQKSSEDQESSCKKVITKTVQQVQEITSQKQNRYRYFTNSILPLHHIVYSCLQFSRQCSWVCVLCWRVLQPSQGQNAPVSGQQFLRRGSVLHILLLWSRILLLLPFPFSFTLLLMEIEIQFSPWWTLTILEMPHSLPEESPDI